MRSLSVFIILSILSPFAFAATFNEAFKLTEDKKYNEAAPLLINLIKSNTDKNDKATLGRAEFELAGMYFRGDGVEKNLETGLRYLNQSIANDHLLAAVSLAELYRIGKGGVVKDLTKAEELFLKSIEIGKESGYQQGDIHFKLYEIYKQMTDKKNYKVLAMQYLNLSSEANYELAKLRMATEYDKGGLVDIDYNKAAEFFKIAGELRYHYSYYRLADYAEQGIGPYKEKEIWTSTSFLEKSAEMGNIAAMADLGERFYKGDLIPQNYKEAIKWLKKANDKGNRKAKYYYADAHEHGNGVEKKLETARLMFGFARYKDSYKRSKAIESELKCPSSAKTELFGIRLICAERGEMMAAIKKQGAKVIREDNKYIADTYNSASILDGTDKLTVFYTKDKFVSASYKFPGAMDKQLVDRVKSMVSSKYGRPSKSSGRVNLGKVSHEWKLEDGIKLKVYRGWPNTTTYLEYIYPKNDELLNAFLDNQKKKKEQEKYSKQAGAF